MHNSAWQCDYLLSKLSDYGSCTIKELTSVFDCQVNVLEVEVHEPQPDRSATCESYELYGTGKSKKPKNRIRPKLNAFDGCAGTKMQNCKFQDRYKRSSHKAILGCSSVSFD